MYLLFLSIMKCISLSCNKGAIVSIINTSSIITLAFPKSDNNNNNNKIIYHFNSISYYHVIINTCEQKYFC